MNNEMQIRCVIAVMVVILFCISMYHASKSQKENKRADYWVKECRRLNNTDLRKELNLEKMKNIHASRSIKNLRNQIKFLNDKSAKSD